MPDSVSSRYRLRTTVLGAFGIFTLLWSFGTLHNIQLQEMMQRDQVNLSSTGNQTTPSFYSETFRPISATDKEDAFQELNAVTKATTSQRTTTIRQTTITEPWTTSSPPAKNKANALWNSSCSSVELPSLPADTADSWQATAADNASFVYSAHRDPRSDVTLLVHVTGIMLTQQLYNATGGRLFCQLWDPDSGMTAVAEGSVRGIAHRMQYDYENFIMLCEFDPLKYVPGRSLLSVVTEPCDPPQNALRIHDNVHSPRPPVNHTVCICGSMRNNYSDYQRFIEWMELNAILGVQRTIIYDTDSAAHMQQVFQYYAGNGVLESIQWNLPNVLVRKYAHLAMVHDCLMRTMMKTKYVAFIDVNETIAPRKPTDFSWDDMIQAGGCEGRSYIALANVFFHPEWESDELYAKNSQIANKWRLYTLLKTKRETIFMGLQDHSKNILRPESVDYFKLHVAFLKADIKEEVCFLDSSHGALHHYRGFYDNVVKGKVQEPEWVKDRTLHKYSDLLIDRVEAVYTDLGLLDDIAT